MQTRVEELLAGVFGEVPAYSIEPVPFGLTNLTKIVKVNGGKYVARIYGRHTKDVSSIELESKITSFLNHSHLSFQVPAFLQAKTGKDYVKFSDGTLGALITFLEGSVPAISSTQQAEQLGRIVGELSSALAKYDTTDLERRGTPFSQIYSLHPLADRDAVKRFIEEPPFSIPQEHIAFYHEMMIAIEQGMHLLDPLPRQFVHHDLLIFNLLAVNNSICGVLDFDLISYDASFMEFAISLNHVLQMSQGSLEMAEAFTKGYTGYCKHSSQEIGLLQLMTQIYHAAVLHFYIGQHYSGKNIEQNFNYILNQFKTRNDWLNSNSPVIKQMLESHLL